MNEVTPGDVVEIHVGNKKAYAQITHNHPATRRPMPR